MAKERFSKERLVKLMDDRGLNAEQLAAKVGVTRQTIHHLRKGGRTTTKAEVMQRIADALGTTVDYLLGGGEDQPPVPDAIRRLSEIANRLSGIRQEELIRIAEALAKLEREQPMYTLPTRAMEVLLEAAGEMGIEDESLDELQELMRSQPPARLIDLGSSKSASDFAQDQ